jgi:hypothetical protein
MHNLHPEVFRLHNDVNTKHIDKKTIHELLFWKKKLPESSKEALENIIKQYNDIFNSLKPMMKLGITFDLWLVGGSVRDLLLGNAALISDLDIMLTFRQAVQPKIPKVSYFMKKSKLNFTKEQLQPIIYKDDSGIPFKHWSVLETVVEPTDWKIEQSKQKFRPIALFDILACCLAQDCDLYEIYSPKVDGENSVELTERYVDHRISGVLKIRKDNWKWPVDIIVSENYVNDFIESFDFGICKAAIELLRGSDIREQRKINPHTPKSLMTRARLNPQFIKDYQSKELNMNISSAMTLRQVKHSVEKHLPKLEAKYPWPVNVKEGYVDDFETGFSPAQAYAALGVAPPPPLPVAGSPVVAKQSVIATYLEAFFMARQLEKSLDRKEFEPRKKAVNKI